MDVGAPLIHGVVPSRVVAISRRLATAPFAVAAIVTLSSLIHAALAWRRATPGYFPDEYMYAELGRSLLDHGSPLVRGESSHFLPLLYPLLTAPAWLWDDVEVAYRTVQAFNAVAMSLAAVPVFLLARRLRVGDRLALTAAALAVALPELLYSSSVLAEPLAYPLALTAVAIAVAVLERPLVRLQLAFLAFAGLAACTRIQLVVLPLCYLLAVIAVGLRERSVRAQLRQHWLAAGTTVVFLTAGLAVGLLGSLGVYGSLTAYSVDPSGAAKAFGVNAIVLGYAVGWVLAPGALMGLALALARPRTAGELAFGVVSLSLLVSLLVQAALVGDVGRVQERYLIYAAPLVVCLFALYAARGWPHLRAHALVAGAAATAAAVVPLAGYAAGGGTGQSFVLVSLQELERLLGDVGLASLAFAVAATIASALVLVAACTRPRVGTVAALALASIAGVGMTTAAHVHYEANRSAVRAIYLPADPSWVDAAAAGPVTLLAAPHSARADLLTTLFWNRSVRRLVLLDGVGKPDTFAAPSAALDGAGHLVGTTGFVLADTLGSSLVLRDAVRVATGPTKTLWRSEGVPQLQVLMAGRYFNGLLLGEGALRVWPERAGGRLAGWLELDLSAPRGTTALPFRLALPDGSRIERPIHSGAGTTLRIRVCGQGVWKAPFSAGTAALADGTRVGLSSAEPRLVEDPAACR
ncbi:MAG TPA: hypothetical protein VM049_08520 [Gaiellaceae bacterium]|nr:hypothetical protein [Gaiellaceae bacterium]